MVYIRKRKLKRDLKSGRKIYTHYNIEREYRTEDKENPQSESIAALGSDPSPEDLLEVIESEGLEEHKEDLIGKFYEKVEGVKEEYTDFEEFRDSVLGGEIQYSFLGEKYLQNFLLENFENFLPNLEKFHVDGSCKEVKLGSSGQCDILAKDRNTGDLIVIELKNEKATKETLGQLLSYIDGAEKKLAGDNQEVKGLVIAKEFGDDFRSAKNRVSDEILMKKYSVDVQMRDV